MVKRDSRRRSSRAEGRRKQAVGSTRLGLPDGQPAAPSLLVALLERAAAARSKRLPRGGVFILETLVRTECSRVREINLQSAFACGHLPRTSTRAYKHITEVDVSRNAPYKHIAEVDVSRNAPLCVQAHRRSGCQPERPVQAHRRSGCQPERPVQAHRRSGCQPERPTREEIDAFDPRHLIVCDHAGLDPK
jgi:hypothetical protein